MNWDRNLVSNYLLYFEPEGDNGILVDQINRPERA